MKKSHFLKIPQVKILTEVEKSSSKRGYKYSYENSMRLPKHDMVRNFYDLSIKGGQSGQNNYRNETDNDLINNFQLKQDRVKTSYHPKRKQTCNDFEDTLIFRSFKNSKHSKNHRLPITLTKKRASSLDCNVELFREFTDYLTKQKLLFKNRVCDLQSQLAPTKPGKL